MRSFTNLGHKIVALATASLLAPGPSTPRAVSFGIVIHAERSHIGEAAASPGSTIFNGDRLSTEPGGVLRVSFASLMFQLGSQSSIVVGHAVDPRRAVSAELLSGTLIFSAAPASDVVVKANEALLRPSVEVPTVAQIRVVGHKELRICAQRGQLNFSYQGESEAISEGTTYRVLLDPSPAEVAAAARSGQVKPPAKPRHHIKFILIAIAVAAGIAIPVIIHHLESPDTPGLAPPSARIP